MEETKLHEIMALKDKSLDELRAKYEELFDDQKPSSNNKVFLWRELAYRMQELEYKGLVGSSGNVPRGYFFQSSMIILPPSRRTTFLSPFFHLRALIISRGKVR